jgi:hypothetical protein
MELSGDTKTAIVNQKLESFNQQVYSLNLDLKCADALEDDKWLNQIRESSKRLMKCIEILEKELAEQV